MRHLKYYVTRAVTVTSLLAASSVVPLSAAAQSEQYRAPDGARYFSSRDTGAVARAASAYRADPSVANAVALGTAQAGIREFREAIATFSDALTRHPDAAILLRWRGHRHLTLREFARARADLERAARLDSLLYGAWYHLGIVHFVDGRFEEAASAFTRALPLAPDAGELAGSVDWLWMSLMRARRIADATELLARRPDSIAVANAYARRLRLYRGEVGPEAMITSADTADVQVSTLAFGVGQWYRIRGDSARARAWYERAIAAGGWPGFGFIVAEAELRELGR